MSCLVFLSFNIEFLVDQVELRTGRHLQYEVSGAKKDDTDYESGYVTVIRKTPDCQTGRATALFNWKAIDMEVLN